MIHPFQNTSSHFSSLFLGCLILLTASTGFGEDLKRVVFLGDSITAGYGLKKEQAYPSIIKQLAAADGYKLKVINAGLSGDTTSGGLRRIRVLVRQPIDILIIALGGNDGLRGIAPKVSQTNLENIIDLVQKMQPDTQIILAGMQMPENMGKEYIDGFRKIFAEVTAKKNVLALPFLLDGVAADKSLNLPDGIHPNVKGQTIVAANVYKAMVPLLK